MTRIEDGNQAKDDSRRRHKRKKTIPRHHHHHQMIQWHRRRKPAVDFSFFLLLLRFSAWPFIRPFLVSSRSRLSQRLILLPPTFTMGIPSFKHSTARDHDGYMISIALPLSAHPPPPFPSDSRQQFSHLNWGLFPYDGPIRRRRINESIQCAP